jgi:hypothetical protein
MPAPPQADLRPFYEQRSVQRASAATDPHPTQPVLTGRRSAGVVEDEIYGLPRVRLVPLSGEALGFGNLPGSHLGCSFVAPLDRCLAVFTLRQPRRGRFRHM